MEFLNYHHLRYFWAVAREGGLKKASDKLRISQPTISAQIASLEAVFGEKLFRRTGRSLVLTEAGNQVLSYAKEIFSLGEELVSAIRHQPTSRRLRVNVGIVDSVPKLMANEVIKPVFHLDRPIQVTCLEGKLADLLAQLATYRIDLVLADEPAPSTMNIQVFNHLLGECSVTFCAEARLATKLRRGFPKSLNDAPALLPTVDTPLRRSLEKWFQAQGIRPRLVGEFDDAALMKVVAVDGLGFLPLPTLVAAEAVARYGLRIIGSTDACQQQFYAISAERKLTHPAVFAITSTARKRLFAHD